MIYKAQPTEQFTMLSNTMLQSEGMTWEAKGMLGYLLSLPDDAAITMAWLESKFPGGKHKTRRIVKELIEARFIHRRRRPTKSGAYRGWDYAVYAAPIAPESKE